MSMDFDALMTLAIQAGQKARLHAPPNPWVGALLVSPGGEVIAEGHTQVPGESHAEVEALRRAGERARGATMVITLEPCCHQGRTGPCTTKIIESGVARVVIGALDPDPRVAGQGVALLEEAGIEIVFGVAEVKVQDELAPYLWHRRTGRPYVVAKIASTLDGVVAMADGTSQWITGPLARRDAHVLRAQSQAIIVGAHTVRSDDPQMTARLGDIVLEPLRVVLGAAPKDAKIRPCLERQGDLGAILDELGQLDVIQVLVEGGPTTTGSFFAADLVNRVVWYQAPAFAGSTGTLGALEGLSTSTIGALRRGRMVEVRRIGDDIRVDVEI